MGDTKIQWTGKTWNPIRARNKATGKVGWFCEHVSEGCRNCYAERMNVNTYFGNGLNYKPAALDQVELFLDEKILQQPLHWRKPTMVFPCSMTDAFARFVKDEWLDQMMAVAGLAKQHTFQFLTKRADRAHAYMTRLSKSVEPLERAARGMGHTFKFTSPLDGNVYGLLPWPIPNIWLGTSVEDQKTADERIPLLLQTPAAVRWISAEPLLDRIDLSVGNVIGGAECRCGDFVVGDHGPYGNDPCRVCRCKVVTEPWTRESNRRLDWVVVGGESGAGARPMYVNSARSIIQQCQAAAVPVFMKQLGAWPSISAAEASGTKRKGTPGDWYLRLQDKKGGDINEWPEDLRVREFPKVA